MHCEKLDNDLKKFEEEMKNQTEETIYAEEAGLKDGSRRGNIFFDKNSLRNSRVKLLKQI